MKKTKRGDTLIEVALAIGIFSMVAISITAVVNASTSSAQSALENTVAREEIDAQAEAIRFIHASYVASSRTSATGESPYIELWRNLIKNAEKTKAESLYYNPSTCAELYDNNKLYDEGAFILNTRRMSDVRSQSIITIPKTENISNTYATAEFAPATTYPRIIYGDSTNDNNDSLYDQTTTDPEAKISRVEGFYIIAVKDNEATYIVDSNGNVNKNTAYYDFYIRSCWFDAGADRPSTISTVIRLYDPNAITYQHKVTIKFNPNSSGFNGSMEDQIVLSNNTVQLRKNTYSRPGYRFVGWNNFPDGTGNIILPNEAYYNPGDINIDQDLTLYAQWERE